ncbi:MAG: hypothetical protein FWC67_02185 [Defluviitaleaceae bacterium]|nr:hypothetical protein [Defluviitaleaceae bacterium]
MRFVLGFIIFAIGMAFMQLISGGMDIRVIGVLADAPTLIGIVAAILAVTVATGQMGIFLAAIKSLFTKNSNLSADDAAKAAELFKLLRKTTFAAGVLIALTALVLMLGNLQDINMLAANTALALLGIYYAVAINLIIFNPIIAILQRHQK